MFMQVNARCAHQRRPPLEAESSTENDDTSRQVVDRWPTALSPTLFEKRPPKRINGSCASRRSRRRSHDGVSEGRIAHPPATNETCYLTRAITCDRFQGRRR